MTEFVIARSNFRKAVAKGQYPVALRLLGTAIDLCPDDDLLPALAEERRRIEDLIAHSRPAMARFLSMLWPTSRKEATRAQEL